MSRGFVWIQRGFLDHPIFAKEPLTEREAFLWMITEAAWKPRRTRVHHTAVMLERGQLAHSTRFMAAAWQWSEARVRRYLNRLKIDAMVKVESDAHATRVTICNYDKYQSKSDDGDAETTQPSDAHATHMRRKQEPRNQITKEEKKDSSADAPVSIPSFDFPPQPAAPDQAMGAPEWTGSAEERFWNLEPAAKTKGIVRGQMGQLAKLLGGDFERGLGIMADAMAARGPRAYLAKVINNLRQEDGGPPATQYDPSAPVWVNESRVQYGYPVEREGKYWRMAGALYDDEGEQVGN